MAENRSLDDFLAADETDDEEDTDSEAEADGETGDDAQTAADGAAASPDRPLATYRWSAGDEDCPVCGTSARARWRDGEQFVCADCKEW